MMNAIFKMVIGSKAFLAPVDTGKIQRVLDMGTGTGICRTFPRVWSVAL